MGQDTFTQLTQTVPANSETIHDKIHTRETDLQPCSSPVGLDKKIDTMLRLASLSCFAHVTPLTFNQGP